MSKHTYYFYTSLFSIGKPLLKTRLRHCTLLIVLSFISVFLEAQHQELPFTHFSNDKEINPLPAAAVTAIFQDQDGYIWMAPYSAGLVRYDGNAMEHFTEEQGLSSYIFSITQDKKGRLWVGNAQNGLQASTQSLSDYAAGDTITFSKTIDGIQLPASAVTSRNRLVADTYGNIWSSTLDDLFRYYYDDKDSLQVDTVQLPNLPVGEQTMFKFLQRANGSIVMIGSNPHHLYHYEPNTEEITYDSISFEVPIAKVSRQVVNLGESVDGTLWIVSKNSHVWSLSPDAPNKAIRHTSLDGKRIQTIFGTQEGAILSGSLGAGVLEWEGGNPENAIYYTPRNGLLSSNIWDFIQDSEGNIWMATNAGVSRLPGDYKAFGHYTANSIEGSPNILPEDGVNAVFPDLKWKFSTQATFEKMLVAGTSKGLSIIRQDGSREIMTSKEGLLSDLVLGIHQDHLDRLWILSRNGFSGISQNPNLLKLSGLDTPTSHQLWGEKVYVSRLPFDFFTRAKTFLIPKSETDRSLVEVSVFMGNNTIIMLIEEEWIFFTHKSGLKTFGLQDIVIDDQYYIYLGNSTEGIFKTKFPMTIEKLSNLKIEYGTNERYKDFKEVIEPVFESRTVIVENDTLSEVAGLLWWDSLLWAGTNKGILALETGAVEPLLVFNMKDGMEKNSASSLLINQDSSILWASSGHGLYGIDLQSKELIKKVKKKDGLVSNVGWAYPAIVKNEEGIIYFATNKGLSIYDPLKDKSDRLAPSVRFRNIQFDESANGNNELQVEYAALSFTNEGGIRYKTKLNGYDENWSEETTNTKIRYTNLPASFWSKKYTFQVLAGDEEGNWMETPQTHSFYVKPPWYLHWLSMIAYSLLGIFLVSVWIRWRTANLKKRQVKLEQIVTERTAEVVAQKEVIEKEKERSEELLLNILPAETAEELKQYGSAKTKNYDLASIIFTDFKDFTKHAERLSPRDLVLELDYCFKAFDHIMSKYNIEKIKTIGDAYMAAAGLPTPTENHPIDAVKAALDIRDFIKIYIKERQLKGIEPFEIRIGVHTGPVVAGIVGIKKFAYDIWGNTVNLAARMEGSGEVGKVNISADTYNLIKEHPEFSFVSRGKILAKNKGEIDMYFVDWSN